MNPLLKPAMEWLLDQEWFCLEKVGSKTWLRTGGRGFVGTNPEDAIIDAFETLHAEPARKEIRESERPEEV